MDEGDLTIENTAPAPPAPASVEAPAVAPSPVGASPSSEAPPVAEAAPKHPSEIPTLLETLKVPKEPGPAKEAAKPAESAAPEAQKVEAKAEEKKPEEPVKAPEPAPETPIEYKFEWSEHVKPEAAKVEAWTGLAREARMTPEAAQKAVGLFNDAANAFVADQQRKQIETWNDTRANWEKQIKADPMIGGAGSEHAQGVIARMRDEFLSDAKPGTPQYDKDAKEFETFLRVTGAGSHPVFHKMLYRVGGKFDEPRAPTIAPQPTKTNGLRPSNSLYATKPASARQ